MVASSGWPLFLQIERPRAAARVQTPAPGHIEIRAPEKIITR
jgi:hypothetical protein